MVYQLNLYFFMHRYAYFHTVYQNREIITAFLCIHKPKTLPIIGFDGLHENENALCIH